MKIIKPKKIQKGDLIGIISPASNTDETSRIEKGVKYLESLGYKVEPGKSLNKSYGYLAGKDELRIDDIYYMFAKKEIKMILCLRGGYGTPRILDKLNYKLIKKNPKVLVGYSDITALQMAIFKKTGMVTFAGPMLAVDFWNNVSKFTEENFWRCVTSNKKIGKIKNPNNEEFKVFKKGNSEGILLGGNLSLISSLLGTEFLPSFKEKILMLEDIAEPPYKIDRMLNQLRLAKIFKKISGLILGDFTDCNENNPAKKTLTLEQVFEDHFSEIKIPVISNLKHGHLKDNITIPFGVNCKINSKTNSIEITESGVE